MRRTFVLLVACAHHAPAPQPPRLFTRAHATPCEAATARVLGCLYDRATGAALENAAIVLTPGDVSVVSDAHGGFGLDVAAGSYQLTVYYAEITGAAPVIIGDGAQVQLPDLLLDTSSPGELITR